MRAVFGVLVLVLATVGWVADPLALRDRVAEEVRPDEETVKEMRAAVEVIVAAISIRAPELNDETRDTRN